MGYPSCPDQSDHDKVFRLLRPERIGLTLTDAWALVPEQSTVAIVAHHPQAVYFGMKSGSIPEEPAPDEVTELMAKLEAEGEFAEQLYTHGLGVQAAEGMAEWLHARVRSELGVPATQGRRWSWGYPACPDQSEHEKVFRLLDAPSIGLRLSGGYAVEPEQSTVAIVAHHPQAVYFGMKSGFIPKGGVVADEVIAGTERDPRRQALPPEDFAENVGDSGDAEVAEVPAAV